MGSNDRTHHRSKEQRDRYKRICILKRNTDEGTGQGTKFNHSECYSAIQERHMIAAADPSTPPSFSTYRSSSMALSLSLNHLLPIWREEIRDETRLGNRGGGATTASGILGHLAAKTTGARHSRKVTLMCFFSPQFNRRVPPMMAIFQ